MILLTLSHRRLSFAALLVCSVLSTFLIEPLAAPASAADLDRTFGRDGRVTTPLDRPEPTAAESVRSAAAADGGVLAADSAQLVRYRPDGSVDRGFGVDGSVRLPIPPDRRFSLAAIAIDAQGNALLAGTLFSADPIAPPSNDPPYVPLPRREALLIRIGPDGAFDQSFGSGGVLRSSWALPTAVDSEGRPYGAPSVSLVDLALDSQGRIVLAGTFAQRIGICGTDIRILDSAFLLRLLPGGQPDATFGEGGKTIEPSLHSVAALALGGDRPFVAGTEGSACEDKRSLLFGFRVDGKAATGFARSGHTRIFSGVGVSDLAVDRLGRPVVLGLTRSAGPADGIGISPVLRLTADGRRDPTFGRVGHVSIPILGRQSYLTALALAADGSVFAAGTRVARSSRYARHSRFLVVAISAPGGRVEGRGAKPRTTGFGRDVNARAQQAFFDTRGRLVLAGPYGSTAAVPGEGLALARYRLDR